MTDFQLSFLGMWRCRQDKIFPATTPHPTLNLQTSQVKSHHASYKYQ